jgi:hypothetical protein
MMSALMSAAYKGAGLATDATDAAIIASNPKKDRLVTLCIARICLLSLGVSTVAYRIAFGLGHPAELLYPSLGLSSL